MKRKYKVYQINSFTQEKFSGNPAGVVVDAQGLTDLEMRLIARELNNSETAFLLPASPTNNDYDVEVRFFTPTTEVPICGHATIAAHFVRALETQVKSGQSYFQKTKAGILPIEIVDDNGLVKIKMTQGKISFTAIERAQQLSIIGALGLVETDLLENSPVEIVSTGHSKVLIGIKSRKKLNDLSPVMYKLKEISSQIHCNGYFVFTFDSDSRDILTHGRMFAPAIGIDEDPVTGNANGPLGAYIVKHNLIKHDRDSFSFTAKQGEAMGRVGTLDVMVEISEGIPKKVSILGGAVSVFETTIEL